MLRIVAEVRNAGPVVVTVEENDHVMISALAAWATECDNVVAFCIEDDYKDTDLFFDDVPSCEDYEDLSDDTFVSDANDVTDWFNGAERAVRFAPTSLRNRRVTQ